MGISEEESIRRLTDEKSSIGHSAKWVAIISAVYFVIMLFYQHELGVLALAGGIFVVSFSIWMKKRQKVKSYKDQLQQMGDDKMV
ncbi:ABC transporter ATP-binding protein [Yersinia enterocolitica]|uniref:ABC transporter ATP-binding protein n=1 Tax=Yersinia enterocolitica TaxID=630 RepID=UPI0028A56424|nr:ABC transporter ATP-binding protein [Yersinia enterocolitica]EKN5072522.1 ABC transporter ATP-binding protein [Yersinia enterocolitica]EKN5983149.1 ABC transporter ATP-binding protein [Yersinia enterocolitica]EKN5987441.1 ABC transporter ATP-binding protein [Yersinia enterocolitica]ELX2240912.1 ABC transporter ATP-binding protein [Yersinia enterocolitica]